MKRFLKVSLLYFIFIVTGFFIMIICFSPIFKTKSLIFPYAIHPFDICKCYPKAWLIIKRSYILSFFISYNIFIFKILKKISIKFKPAKKHKNHNNEDKNLNIVIGTTDNDDLIKIEENGLYQNIFITGTIGSGKTSSAMYPFTKQLLGFKADNTNEKLAMLILDVKGNYSEKVVEFSKEANRLEDVFIVDISGNFRYNPLDKPLLRPAVLANRLKTILTLFSKNNTESYWLDKAEQILTECIKFCRIYNDGYVDFIELHKLIMIPEYYNEKVSLVRKKFMTGRLTEKDIYELLSCINFFEKEFFSLDSRTISILKSEISRITNIFISDYNIQKAFCPQKEENNFTGFDEVLDKGKIVVLNMNISEYKNLSKIIAAYLKLDFQSTVLSKLSGNQIIRRSAFICDEYHEYVTDNDAEFFSQSREAKCINIVSTQSYTSLLNTLKEEATVKVIIQSLVNKIWFRTDDSFTIEEIQKQIGKEEKEKFSTTISENAKETEYNLITNRLISRDSNISESYNQYTEKDYIYDTNFISQKLKTFTALAFISDGFNIIKPQKIDMIPYFKNIKNNLKGFDLNEK